MEQARNFRRRAARVLSLCLPLCLAVSPPGSIADAAAPPLEEPQNRTSEKAIPALPLVVRGSVGQIHLIHATPDSEVSVRGPDGFEAAGRTDSSGGLILVDVPPAGGYHVTVAGEEKTVRVLHPDDHPPREFYAAQTLEPTQGYLKTRDGTLLCYRVTLPDPEKHGSGPYDLVITYSGYQPALVHEKGHQNQAFEKFNALGYAVAGVNLRGSACSGGAFRFMEPLVWLDGYDMVEAFSAQEWVDDVALGDQSWPGLTQLYVASTRPPSLDAIVAGSVVGDLYRDVFYPGGIENVGFGHIWGAGRDVQNAYPSRREDVMARIQSDPVAAANQGLRGQNVSLLETIRSRPFDEAYWRSISAEPLVHRITVPTLQTVSWQDPQCGGRPAMLQQKFAPGTPMRLVGINGFHQYYSGAVWDEIAEFLDLYLGESPAEKIAAYEAQNSCLILLEADSKAEVRGRFSLPDIAATGEGRRLEFGSDLSPDDPDSDATSSSFTSNTTKPGSWTKPLQDRVAFTSEPLDDTLVMAGPGSVDLWIAAEAEDVDLQVTLSELRPDGHEMLIQSGWLRASHRALDEAASTAIRPVHLHTKAAAKPLPPGEWTALRIELFPFAHVFRKGSQVRVNLSGPGGGSNGWPWAFGTLPGKTKIRVAHDGDAHSSSIVLPVVHPEDLVLPDSLAAPDGVWLQPSRPAEIGVAPREVVPGR
ncbi:MAG: CocE/NonD family hydrolase [Verrucomicrobiaceae bacterium]|nr:CocE/NonD family hydrolase [Verrucomicrobiaceae bacterium]